MIIPTYSKVKVVLRFFSFINSPKSFLEKLTLTHIFWEERRCKHFFVIRPLRDLKYTDFTEFPDINVGAIIRHPYRAVQRRLMKYLSSCKND